MSVCVNACVLCNRTHTLSRSENVITCVSIETDTREDFTQTNDLKTETASIRALYKMHILFECVRLPQQPICVNGKRVSVGTCVHHEMTKYSRNIETQERGNNFYRILT